MQAPPELSHSMSEPWYLAQLKPNSTQIAKRNLGRQGFETFLPLHEETKKVRGKFLSVIAPLFPGYIFVRRATAQSQINQVNSTYGISRMVNFGREARPVPANLMVALQERCDVEGKLLPPQVLEVGMPVRVISGPFAEFTTNIEHISADRRLWVLLDILGKATRVSIKAENLAPKN